MTDREFYTNIVNGTVGDEVIAKAQAKLTALDNRNAKAKDKKAEEHAETDANVIAALTADPQIAADIAAVTGYSTSKVAASCKRLAAEGKVAIGEVKANGRMVKSYALAPIEE